MPINLQKGQKVSLTKGNPGLTKVVVGLGWDVNQFDTGGSFDLDAAAFLVTDAGKVSRPEDFVFYGNLTHPSGSVQHLGDNLTGEGDGDDEQIKVNLAAVPSNISKIVFTVTIYDAETRRQNFGQVNNASSAFTMRRQGRRCCVTIWGRISPSRRRQSLGSCTKTGTNGSSTPSAAATRGGWRPCAQATAWMWNDRDGLRIL